jgi:uncharacterized membrane protein
MDTKLIILGVIIIIILGLIRHFVPGGMLPGIFRKKNTLPGYLLAGLGVLMAIAGILLE